MFNQEVTLLRLRIYFGNVLGPDTLHGQKYWATHFNHNI